MDSSYFLISSNSTSTSTLNNEFDHLSSSSSPFSNDPFDGFPFLDQQGMPLYDYFNYSSSSSPSNLNSISGGGLGSGSSSINNSNCNIGSSCGRNSPSSSLINQYSNNPLIDHLDHLHQTNNHHNLQLSSPYSSLSLASKPSHPASSSNMSNINCSPFLQTDPNQEDDDDLQGTLTSFVGDLGADSDAGYTSGVDLFASSNNHLHLHPHHHHLHQNHHDQHHNGDDMVDCTDSAEAYYLRLALEQNNSLNHHHLHHHHHHHNHHTNSFGINGNNNNYSDIISNNNFNNYDCNNVFNNNCNSDSNINGQTGNKRSVLMNLLIDGSDVGAGYTSHNCRALPQRLVNNNNININNSLQHDDRNRYCQQQQQHH